MRSGSHLKGQTFGDLKVLSVLGRQRGAWLIEVQCLRCDRVYERTSYSLDRAGACSKCRNRTQRVWIGNLFKR